MKTQNDVLLVTVTRVESRAVLDAFERHTGQPAKIQPRGDKTYHDLGVVNGARVWLVLSEMGAGGLGGSQQSVGKAIAEIRPLAVVMVGIAFGMSEEHQAIGDILVSENLRLYELQRAGTEIILRGDRPHASPRLLDAFRNNAYLHWHGADVRFGCVLTGEKLVDNLDFREQLRRFEPEAVGGEMEGAGLYTACQDAKVDWLLIKAICDWADGNKEVDRQPRQQLAASNAAAFVLHTLQTVGLNKQNRGDDPADDELLQTFTASLSSVADDCSKLVTRGISVSGDTHQKPLRLAHVYVSLDTKSPRPDSRENAESTSKTRETLSALEALFDSQTTRVVLVGEPGSGKSTFLQYVTLCLADRLCVAGGRPSHMAGLPVPEFLRGVKALPLRILLREFAAELDAAKPGTSEDVERFLRAQLEDDSHGDAAAKLPELLQRGLAFVLFDGMDEVPRALVPAVRQAITAFAAGGYRKCRVAVTCRTESYRKKNAAGEFEFKLATFPAPHEIAPLSPEHRKQFVRAWYHELEEVQPQFRGEGASCAASLLNALGTERLREMAGNPFFLTAMAALHRPDKPLPDTSAELMHLLVNGVLEEARKPAPGAGSRTGELELAALLRPIKDGLKVLRLRLEAIAYAAREKRQDQASRLVDEDLLRARLLLDKKVNEEWVDRLIECLLHRAGLLQSQDGRTFEFAYRFEEFLAGCHLANRDAWVKLQPSFARRARELLKKQDDYARQVVIWAAGVNAHVQIDRSTVRELVSELTPKCAVAGAGSLTDLELAAEIARDAGMDHWQDEDVPDTGDTVSRLRSRLEEVRDDARGFDIEARSRAASAIGRLGDQRAGAGLRADGLPDIDFDIEIPPGPFPMGDPPKICEAITEPYRISRYPVTVAQYQTFVAAGGYEDDGSEEATQRLSRWWTPEGLQWKRDADIAGPDENEPVFQTPNHPRVGVSWYEAVAFCRWLSEKLEQPIALPGETQWERAARHTDGRLYPWGREEDDLTQRCNMGHTGLQHTSAVGLFPGGKAECGALDMAGNVWEWCEDLYQADKPYRVLRGGSWSINDPAYLRCACRSFSVPGCRLNVVGFRVVWLVGCSARG